MATIQTENQLFQFSIKFLLIATVAASFFALLMQFYGVNVILPWALFAGIMGTLFLIGKWLTVNIQESARKDPLTPKVLQTFNSQYEAQVFISRLAEHGIEAKSVGGFVSGFQAESPGYVDVVVQASVFENAKKVEAILKEQKIEGVQATEG